MKKQSCTVDGIHYESENAAAKALDLQVSALRYRLRSSNFPEYISKLHPKEARRPFFSCTIDGVEYETMEHAAKEFGISGNSIKNRLASSNYPDYICAEIPKKTRNTKCTYAYVAHGKKYATLQEIADVEGLSRERIRQKMNNPSYAEYRRLLPNGSPAPRPERNHIKSTNRPCTIDGVEHESEKAAAEALGLDVASLCYRLKSSNFPEYISKLHPKINVKKDYLPIDCSVAGIEYKSAKSASRALGITPYEMRHRLASPDYPDYISPRIPKKQTGRRK